MPGSVPSAHPGPTLLPAHDPIRCWCTHGEPVFFRQVAMNILNSGRFSMGSTVAGMLKKLIGR